MNLTSRMPSRPALAASVAAVILGAAIAAAGPSSAQTTTPSATSAVLPMSAGPWPPGP